MRPPHVPRRSRSTQPIAHRSFGTRLRRFARTPKGLLSIVFVAMLGAAFTHVSMARVGPGLAGGMAVAALVDGVVTRWRRRRWEFPSGAILTALLVTMVLSPYEPWYVSAGATAMALASKHIVRSRRAARARPVNVFNPAAVGLVAAFYAFDAAHTWWGALADVAPALGWPLLLAAGAFIVDRVNKVPLVLAFLAGYFSLFSLAAFLGDPGHVAEVFVAPDLQAVLFFACFMLSDPPTSPASYADQLICGTLVAVVSFGTFELTGVAYYLLAGVLVGNVFHGWRRNRWRLPLPRQRERLVGRG